MQYTPAGGTVLVSLEGLDRGAIVAVRDTGIGIPTTEHERIFQRFYRVDGDRSRRTGGTGLGLAIARAIVQRHWGRLWLDSESGKGSVFTVVLPCLST